MRELTLMVVVVLLAFIYYQFSRAPDSSENLSSVYEVNQLERQNEQETTSDEIEHFKTVSPSRQAGNLLSNGGFDSSLDRWNHETGITWSDSSGTNDRGALLINAPQIESDSRVIYQKSAHQCVSLEDGTQFSLEANFRYLNRLPQRPSVNRLNVIWYESSDCTTGGQFGSYLEPNLQAHTWQHVFRTQLTPSLGTTSAKIEIVQSQRGNNDAIAIWDNIRFAIVAQQPASVAQLDTSNATKPLGENYLLNGNFDADLTHWWPKSSKRLNWRGINEANRGGVMAATLPNERDSSMGTGAFSQCVNIGQNQRYELGAKVKVAQESNQRGGGRLRPTWYELPNCKGRHRTSTRHSDVDKDNQDWQNLHVDELTPEHNAKSVRISIIHSIDGYGEHTLLWDDIYFRAY